jgi:hypothetical protein
VPSNPRLVIVPLPETAMKPSALSPTPRVGKGGAEIQLGRVEEAAVEGGGPALQYTEEDIFVVVVLAGHTDAGILQAGRFVETHRAVDGDRCHVVVLALLLLLVIPSLFEAFGAALSSPGTNRDRPHANRLSVRAGCPNAAGAKQPVSVHYFARGRLIDEPPRTGGAQTIAIKN